MKDLTGAVIKIGDRVVYSVSNGYHHELVLATVTAIKPDDTQTLRDGTNYRGAPYRKTWHSMSSRILVINGVKEAS